MTALDVFRSLPAVVDIGSMGEQAKSLFGEAQGRIAAVGWAGFQDVRFLIDSTGALLLAVLLGAAIGYHPTTPRKQLHEADMRKVYVMYAFIGAVIGVTVREFGMVIGVVVFGIGGLIRFRTDTDSTVDTGRLIAVTLAGLIAGLGLPHFAVITTAFAFVLIYLFDTNPACRVRIDQLPEGRVLEMADVYRGVLQGHGCKILIEHKSIPKGRIEFVFRRPFRRTREVLHAALSNVAHEVRGDIDWVTE